ncbi:MAG TPA: ABC transporter permease [Candidatus Acidoferrales bacterium]|nr:ABC transporter permease [Candidatus Acidoferrales bacterium]
MNSIWQDLRYSLRMIMKAPGFASIAILTLALGIGANTTIFSWINSALLNPVPGLSSPNEVVALTLSKAGENPFAFTYPDIQAMRNGQKSFTGITACNITSLSLTGKGKPDRIWGMVTTANYFDVLGVRPVLGRAFLPEEDEKPGGAPVAVISYRLWQTHFGASPNVVGQQVEVNQHPYTIVGVTPAVFQGSQTGVRTEIWLPIAMVDQLVPRSDLLHDHHYFWLFAFGRMKPGVRPEKAQEEMTVLLQPEVKSFPEEHRGHDSVSVYPLWRSPFGLNFFLSTLLPMLMAIAGLVLLLACANVANLMLVRSVGRRREMAIRMSLGASRWRLVRQLLAESLLLSLAGGAVALLITTWTAGTFMKFIPVTDFPIALGVPVDRAVLIAAFVISLITGVIFGILPALRASSEAPVAVLKEEAASASGGMKRARLASGLVVAQISLSLVLLVCAGLFIRSFLSAQQINPGFNSHNVLISSYDAFTSGYSDERAAALDRQLEAKLDAMPGIQSAALSNRVPLGFGGSSSVKPEGYVPQADESMETQAAMITPNYFQTLQIPIVKGRDFTMQDNMSSQRVAIVSETFVNRYWPNQEGLGKQVNSDLTHEWFTVVGVARDSKVVGLNEKPTPFLYLPHYQVNLLNQPGGSAMNVIARTTGDPLAMSKSVEQTVHELSADLVVYNVSTLESSEAITSFPQRIAGTFVGAFGLLALVLAAVGIYGVTAYTTRQRTHEIGVRMALGASKQDVLQLVLGHGLRLTFVGVALGLAAAFALTRYLGSMLLGVTSTDALTFSCVAVLLCAVALFACFIPARRAMRVDPIVALRHE